MRRRTTRRALALPAAAAAAALLSACGTGGRVDVPWLNVTLHLPGATPTPQATPPQSEASPTAAAPALTIQQFIPIAEHFVEEHRGHTFKAPVPVTLLDDAAFRQRLLAHTGDTNAITTTSKELKALHLIDQSVDLGSASNDLLGAGVSGFYDPKSKSLVVRGVSATPYVRQVLVHELTHALQDQYFGIDRPALAAADDERALAFQAVYEGDAVRLENMYHDAMTPAEQDESDREAQSQAGGIPASVPRVLVELVTFPYIVGPPFISALQQEGGTAAVDDAFVHPPVSTEQLLNINAYLAGRAPKTVAQPHADAPAFDHGVMGELGLLLLFEKGGEATSQARAAADLWGGDEYVAWNHGNGACVRIAVVADSPEDQATLDASVSAYAQAVNATFTPSRSAGAPSVLTACG
jgi:hypothetical protein